MPSSSNEPQPQTGEPLPPTFEQIAFLINAADPEMYYQRAVAFDKAQQGFRTLAQDLRRVNRIEFANWDGVVADSARQRLHEITGNVTEVLSAVGTPAYGDLMRMAGDSLANSQRRINTLVAQRAEQIAAASEPAAVAAAERHTTETAQQILTELRSTYREIAAAFSPLSPPPRHTPDGVVVNPSDSDTTRHGTRAVRTERAHAPERSETSASGTDTPASAPTAQRGVFAHGAPAHSGSVFANSTGSSPVAYGYGVASGAEVSTFDAAEGALARQQRPVGGHLADTGYGYSETFGSESVGSTHRVRPGNVVASPEVAGASAAASENASGTTRVVTAGQAGAFGPAVMLGKGPTGSRKTQRTRSYAGTDLSVDSGDDAPDGTAIGKSRSGTARDGPGASQTGEQAERSPKPSTTAQPAQSPETATAGAPEETSRVAGAQTLSHSAPDRAETSGHTSSSGSGAGQKPSPPARTVERTAAAEAAGARTSELAVQPVGTTPESPAGRAASAGVDRSADTVRSGARVSAVGSSSGTGAMPLMAGAGMNQDNSQRRRPDFLQRETGSDGEAEQTPAAVIGRPRTTATDQAESAHDDTERYLGQLADILKKGD